MFEGSQDLPRGTLDLLVLKVISLEPMHGWGIMKRVQSLSGGVFELNQGSLYPALQRLKKKGWISSEWRTTENSRKARYYALTAQGRARLAEERWSWERSTAAVGRILEAEG